MEKKYIYTLQRGGEKIEYNLQYTVKFSKSGVNQYARIGVTDDGKVLILEFRPTWVNLNDVPSLENKTFDEVLQTIKDFSYGNRAEIYKINGVAPEYYKKPAHDKRITKSANLIEQTISNEAYKFFEKSLVPLLKKKNLKVSYSWCGKPVLVKQEKTGEWNNYKGDEYFIQYLSYMFLLRCNLTKSVDFSGERDPYLDNFSELMRYVETKQLEKLNLYHENT